MSLSITLYDDALIFDLFDHGLGLDVDLRIFESRLRIVDKLF